MNNKRINYMNVREKLNKRDFLLMGIDTGFIHMDYSITDVPFQENINFLKIKVKNKK